MTTESQVVRQFVEELRKQPHRYDGHYHFLRHSIHQALIKDDLLGGYSFRSSCRRERDFMAARLEKRIRKKAAQPFRRTKRGLMRAKAAGKNEVTRRR